MTGPWMEALGAVLDAMPAPSANSKAPRLTINNEY